MDCALLANEISAVFFLFIAFFSVLSGGRIKCLITPNVCYSSVHEVLSYTAAKGT